MGVIGAAHAGWRGAVDGVLEATIAMMAKQGIAPDQIEAVIGPAIQQANYQVGDDLRYAVLAAHDDADVFFDPDQDMDGKYRFDLPGFVQSRLRKAGLDKVTDLGIDTYGESSGLFSHRHATHAPCTKPNLKNNIKETVTMPHLYIFLGLMFLALMASCFIS
jgi:YfiH family protein